MTQKAFTERRGAFWDRLETTISGGKKALRAEAAWFPRAYRELTQDLNAARSQGFDPALIERLNRLVLEGNQLLYGNRRFTLKPAADFILSVFPRSVRKDIRGIAGAHLLFYGIAFFMALLVVRFPEAVFDIIPEEQVFQLEAMYDPGSGHFLEPRGVETDANMFGFYIYNNISIAFRTFAGGMLAGFGSLLFLCYNALFLGAAAGHIVNKGFAGTFFPFVIGHSAFELTAIILSARAGLILGFSLFFRKGASRRLALKRAGRTALPLVAGAALMLVLAASIEAFWSSRHELPVGLRYGVGAALWLLVILYFALAGRKGEA